MTQKEFEIISEAIKETQDKITKSFDLFIEEMKKLREEESEVIYKSDELYTLDIDNEYPNNFKSENEEEILSDQDLEQNENN